MAGVVRASQDSAIERGAEENVKRLAMILVVVGLVVPAASRADVRFAPALTSSASEPGVSTGYSVVAGNAAGVAVSAYTQKVGAVYHAFARVKPAGASGAKSPVVHATFTLR
jgi:hypothetical protein